MARLLHREFSVNSRKSHIIFLAFLWILGLFSGAESARIAGDSFLSLMRGAAYGSVSIVSLLTVSLLPFLFSAFTFYIRSYRFLAVLCFIKGFLFAFVSSGILLSFSSAGWLVRLLLMFSDACCLVPLWWCWISCCSGRFHGSFAPVMKSCIAAAAIVSLDYIYVSPFMVKLLEF